MWSRNQGVILINIGYWNFELIKVFQILTVLLFPQRGNSFLLEMQQCCSFGDAWVGNYFLENMEAQYCMNRICFFFVLFYICLKHNGNICYWKYYFVSFCALCHFISFINKSIKCNNLLLHLKFFDMHKNVHVDK